MRNVKSRLIPLCVVFLACGPGTSEELSLATSTKLLKAQEPVFGQYIVTLADPAQLGTSATVSQRVSELRAQYGGETLFTYEHAVRGFAVRMSPKQALALAADPRVARGE